MRLNNITFLLALLTLASTHAQTRKAPAINWTDSTRDVYIDNELDRDAQVLTASSPSRLALISKRLGSAIVLNVSEQTVSTIPKDAFQFEPDRTAATSDSATQVVGKFTRVDGPVYFFVASGKPILIRAHPGATGEMSVNKLWETVPVWRLVMMNYQPNAEAVSQIKGNDKETKVTLAFGTWCPDSKNYIPRLMKALEAAGSNKIQLKLIGIDNQFREPVASVQPLGITNVPTIIVERGGREIGRIVETPASGTIEEDLAAILNEKQLVHNGRVERGPRIASGVYSYLDHRGKEVGNESWEMFSTSEGGYLIHSRITTADLSTEIFHRVDAGRRAAFAEVTKIRGADRERTRFNLDGNTLTARTRGSVSGVISQTLEVPARFFLSSPAVAAQGFVQTSNAAHYQISTYLTPLEFDNATAMLSLANCEAGGEETVRVPAGEFRVRHITRKTQQEASDWWVDVKLGIPVKARSGGLEFLLKSLETTNAK
jgi:thiol-disulfide isomerase/thioredoxin